MTVATDTGNVAPTVVASGTVNPVTTVQVGSYVSGVIQSLTCGFNTRVRAGQSCAHIDARPYQSAVDQASAHLAMARAQLEKDRYNFVFAGQALAQDAALVAAQRNALDAARTKLDLAQLRYQAGQASLLQSIEAQRLFHQARLGHVRALGQRHPDTAQVFLATMGDSDEAPPVAVPVRPDGP